MVFVPWPNNTWSSSIREVVLPRTKVLPERVVVLSRLSTMKEAARSCIRKTAPARSSKPNVAGTDEPLSGLCRACCWMRGTYAKETGSDGSS